jgi:hypothetical protein
VLGNPVGAGTPYFGPFVPGLSTLGASASCTFTADASGGFVSSSPEGHLIFQVENWDSDGISESEKEKV